MYDLEVFRGVKHVCFKTRCHTKERVFNFFHYVAKVCSKAYLIILLFFRSIISLQTLILSILLGRTLSFLV
jgi:hypothetical protein